MPETDELTAIKENLETRNMIARVKSCQKAIWVSKEFHAKIKRVKEERNFRTLADTLEWLFNMYTV